MNDVIPLIHANTTWDIGRAGARGLAGTVFVHKLLGAAAEQGRTLEELYEGGEMIVKQLATVGVACSPCVVPGAGPSFSLPPGIVELGELVCSSGGVAFPLSLSV